MADLLHDLVSRDPPQPWRLISSPMRRARATAGAIAARLGLPVEVDERLVEIHVGAWEGLLRSDLERTHPEVFTDSEWLFRSPGGETYEDVMGRVGGWLAEQADEPERRLIVVSHGVAGRLLRGAYARLSRGDVIRSDAPQDAIFRLAGGRLDRLACAPVDCGLETPPQSGCA